MRNCNTLGLRPCEAEARLRMPKEERDCESRMRETRLSGSMRGNCPSAWPGRSLLYCPIGGKHSPRLSGEFSCPDCKKAMDSNTGEILHGRLLQRIPR
jgi:hypothetical protein